MTNSWRPDFATLPELKFGNSGSRQSSTDIRSIRAQSLHAQMNMYGEIN
jgi:hypothetical protein